MPIRLRRASLPPTLAEALLRTPDAQADPRDPAPKASSADTVAAARVDPDSVPEAETLQPPFLSLPEAAEWLCVSKSTVKRLIAKGDLVALRVGARRKIPASCLSAYVKRDILILGDAAEPSSPDQQ